MTENKAIEGLRILTYQCKYNGECGTCEICYDAVPMAIQALENQIPKKPKEFHEKEGVCIDFICPNCKEAVYGQPYKPKHCKHCGQKLDWEGGE